MESKNYSGFYGGITLLVLGTLFLLDNMHILDFGNAISTFWPVVLILIGIHLIMKVRRSDMPEDQPHHAPVSGPGPIAGDRLSENNLFGDIRLKVTSEKFKGGNISNVFGDIDIDLSAGKLESGVTKLNVNGVFGDVHILLPAECGVRVDCSSVAGDLTIEGNRREGVFPRIAYQDEKYTGDPKKLDIHCSVIFGSIRISRNP